MTDVATGRRPLQEEVTGLVRSRVLDSVGELVQDTPWDKISMAALARRAGVSRQTVYNEFGSRDGLAVAYVLREASAFLADVEAAVTMNSDDIAAALRAAIDVFLVAASKHPVFRRIATGDNSDTLLTLVLSSSEAPVLEVAAERLAAVLCETWPAVDTDRLGTLADTAVRLAVSHAAQPADRARPERGTEVIVSVLAPYLDQLG